MNSTLNKYKHKQQGFTLLEVMVALVIFAVSALVILEQTTLSVRQLTLLEEKTLALWVAENSLAQLKLDNTWPNTGSTEYVVNNAERTWRITQNIEDTSNKSLRKITVGISREDSQTISDHSLVTLIGYIGEH